MGQADVGRFARALTEIRYVGVDTPVLIYHFEDVSPYSELTTHLLAQAASGTYDLIVSTITVAEVLTGPWRAGDGERARWIENAMQALPGLTTAGVAWQEASRGAELRGKTGLPLPDVLIMASAVAHGAQVIVTNDASWRMKGLPCRVLVLDEYVRA